MTLKSWHWFSVPQSKSHDILCQIKMFLSCLKINLKHPENIDMEMCRLRPVTSQCMKWLFLTPAMCAKTVSSNETFWYIGCQGKMAAQCHRRYWDAISEVLIFCWHSGRADVISWHYWTILVGRDLMVPWASYQTRKIVGCACTGNAGNVFPATVG